LVLGNVTVAPLVFLQFASVGFAQLETTLVLISARHETRPTAFIIMNAMPNIHARIVACETKAPSSESTFF
jgi:hypothetical protein